jgi:hypothetical protein
MGTLETNIIDNAEQIQIAPPPEKPIIITDLFQLLELGEEVDKILGEKRFRQTMD